MVVDGFRWHKFMHKFVQKENVVNTYHPRVSYLLWDM